MNTNASYILDRNGRMIWRGLGSAQTETGKITQTVRTSTGLVTTLLGIAPVATALGPLGVGTVLLVAGIVAGAATLVDAIWGSSKDKAALEQAGQYDVANSQIRQQIQQLDLHTRSVADGLVSLNDALKSVGLPGVPLSGLRGLGNFASDQLNAAVATNKVLKDALTQKTTDLTALITTFNTAVQDTYDAVTGKSKAEKYILWGLLGLAGLGASWLIYKEAKHQKI